METTLTFIERYTEYRDLGYQDWQIAKRMGCTFKSLARQMLRHGIEVSPEFQNMVYEERRRTGT